MAIPKAKPPRPVEATLDSALARQARAEKSLALVEVQLTAAQQQMEEARIEMTTADKLVDEARQLAVQDTSLQMPKFWYKRCESITNNKTSMRLHEKRSQG